MHDDRKTPLSYECVEPELGEHLWLYDTPEVDPALKDRLDDHLSICAECRMHRALHRRLEAERAGHLGLVETTGRRRWQKGLSVAAVANLAACLLLTLFLPAQDPDRNLLPRRGGNAAFFLAPVTEEVVLGQRPDFAWTAVDNASSYSLAVRSTDGEFEWTIDTLRPEASLPANLNLPADARLQAFVEVTPPYLNPDDGISVTFHTGSPAAYAAYRIGANPWWVWLPGVFGLGLLIGMKVSRTGHRRESPA